MSAQVSAFEQVTIGEFNYLFFVVTWNDYVTVITEEIEKQFEPFGADLGAKGLVVRAFKNASTSTFDEIRVKPWPEDIQDRFDNEQDPFMLIINKDFQTFNPRHDRWSVLWFSDYTEKPERIYKVFGKIANKIRKGENVFDFLRTATNKSRLQKWVQFFSFSPEIFGISIDVKAIFEEAFGMGT